MTSLTHTLTQLPIETCLLDIGSFLRGQDFASLVRCCRWLWENSRSDDYNKIIHQRYCCLTSLSSVHRGVPDDKYIILDLPRYLVRINQTPIKSDDRNNHPHRLTRLIFDKQGLPRLHIKETLKGRDGTVQRQYLWDHHRICLSNNSRPNSIFRCWWKEYRREQIKTFKVNWRRVTGGCIGPPDCRVPVVSSYQSLIGTIVRDSPSIIEKDTRTTNHEQTWRLVSFDGNLCTLFPNLPNQFGRGNIYYRSFSRRLKYQPQNTDDIIQFLEKLGYETQSASGIIRILENDIINMDHPIYLRRHPSEKDQGIIRDYLRTTLGLSSEEPIYETIMERINRLNPNHYHQQLQEKLKPWSRECPLIVSTLASLDQNKISLTNHCEEISTYIGRISK